MEALSGWEAVRNLDFDKILQRKLQILKKILFLLQKLRQD